MDSTSKRATPADPLPGITVDVRTAGQEVATLPPGLGPDAIGVLDGRTFMYSDASGDVPPGSIGGLLVEDTRHLNRWLLTINGQRLIALGSAVTDYYSADFFLTNPGHPKLPANAIDVRRRRVVGRNGLHERIDITSFAARPARVELRLQVGTDFADLLEIRGSGVRDRSAKITREHAADGSRLQFCYANEGFNADTVVHARPPATRVDGDDLVWDLDLQRGEQQRVDLHVPLALGPMDLPSVHVRFDEGEPRDDPTSRWLAERPNIETDSQLLARMLYRASDDLLALRARARIGGEEVLLPSAGVPWFLTLFGRDALIMAYQTIVLNPFLARGTLTALARFQGTTCNDFTDEEPGKILHEVRGGELTRLGEKPYGPYYGTADATQLWLILLSEYWRWTGDDEFVRSLRDNALAALNWIDRYGDRDGDGYVEYGTRSPEGLGNQCWRDSWDGIQFADAELPVLPIATCEIQGYTYDAKLRMAELADGPLADPGLAARLRAEAQQLLERFNRDFWIEERGGYYAVGLDGDKRPIDSMTSSMGHLLWSGIVPEDRAPIVARQLMSESMFSGWGIRTLSTDDSGYNPIGYHTGTVWPHETSLIAAGLTRYGFRAEVNQLALAMLDAAAAFDFRLPETFAGHSRTHGRFPVPYPTPCSPQAWATGAPMLMMRAMLAGEARNGELVVDPHLPDEIGRVLITRLHAFGKRWNIEAIGTIGHVRLTT
ncbi:glycogen debranching N-terminal domain-containing protein [Micromonospora sp. NPDC004540]|uniref:amylo-alpha-1,6-glucosidase n=1 Tax=Micromonospora sp. NPDC004540 TaxID=3154457 RepID=UPI0033BCC892